jgi:energy-coupling factor transporter transmembrane protein EcfT
MIPGAAFARHGLKGRTLPRLHPVLTLGAVVLGIASCLVAGPILLAVMTLLLAGALHLSGLVLPEQLRSLRPWLPMALFILLVHTLTAVAAAPLGTPTWAGFTAGVRSLLRVGCTVAWLAVYIRAHSLDELVGSVRWWLRPLEKLGFPGQDLGLVLAVALGTAPVVLGEGRRIETVVRLRRRQGAGAGGSRRGSVLRWWSRQLDRARVLVPLVETLARRAESLSLSLRSRRPSGGDAVPASPPVAGLVLLTLWAGLLVVALQAGKALP